VGIEITEAFSRHSGAGRHCTASNYSVKSYILSFPEIQNFRENCLDGIIAGQTYFFQGRRIKQMSNSALNISTENYKRAAVITISGRVDSSNAAEFDAALKNALAEGHHNLVIELSGVNYMSSAGLRAIVAAHRESRKKGGDVCLAAPSERVAEVLSLAGLHSVFTVYPDTLAAVGSF
jgi:anti-sigma B factor antagonist